MKNRTISHLKTTSKNILIAAFFAASLAATSPANAATQAVKDALSLRHDVPNVQELEKLAGGEDQLVADLLELRHDNTLPFISIRAEKLLLEFADREDVASALESDLQDPEMQGLARAIALGIDAAPSASQERLARAVISRAKTQSSFVPYARVLLQSKSANVSALARQQLE